MNPRMGSLNPPLQFRLCFPSLGHSSLLCSIACCRSISGQGSFLLQMQAPKGLFFQEGKHGEEGPNRRKPDSQEPYL